MGGVSNKVTVPALAGAVVAVLCWVMSTFVKVEVPADVAVAFSTIVGALIGWVIPHGGDT